ASDQERLSTSTRPPRAPCSKSRTIAQCFLRLSNVDPTLLDRVGSYEARLWRQAAQTIWTLDAMSRPAPASTRRPFRHPLALPFPTPVPPRSGRRSFSNRRIRRGALSLPPH